MRHCFANLWQNDSTFQLSEQWVQIKEEFFHPDREGVSDKIQSQPPISPLDFYLCGSSCIFFSIETPPQSPAVPEEQLNKINDLSSRAIADTVRWRVGNHRYRSVLKTPGTTIPISGPMEHVIIEQKRRLDDKCKSSPPATEVTQEDQLESPSHSDYQLQGRLPRTYIPHTNRCWGITHLCSNEYAY